MRFAGFWIRVVASMLDSMFIVVLSLPTYFFGEPYGFLSQIVIAFLYESLLTCGEHQATWGKRLMGLKVINADGGRLTFGASVGRYAGKILSTLTFFIGFLMVAFTDRKQGLHDRLADTFVVLSADRHVRVDRSPQVAVSALNHPIGSISTRLDVGWVMAGFDESGHVQRFSFSNTDARLSSERGLRIGRSERENDFVVLDGSVSRVHARLYLKDGVLLLEDLGSRNGSFVGGTRISAGQARALYGDQEIRFGDVTFSVGKE